MKIPISEGISKWRKLRSFPSSRVKIKQNSDFREFQIKVGKKSALAFSDLENSSSEFKKKKENFCTSYSDLENSLIVRCIMTD